MRSDLKSFFQDRVALGALSAATGGWLFCLALVALYWSKLPPELPFLYSLPWGESWLVPKENLVYILAGFALVLIFNLTLSRTLAKKEKLLQYYLLWGAAAVEFMLAVNLIKIIRLIL